MSRPPESARGILLRRTRFGDSGLIVGWLTDTHGRIDTSARGALKPGGPFAGLLDLFRECEISFVRSRRTDLCTLREAALLRSHDRLARDPTVLQLAGYFNELAQLCTLPDHAVPEIHDLLSRALGHLEAAPPTRRVLLRFERRLAEHLGVASAEETPAHGLVRLCHRLPVGRTALFDQLPP